MSHRQLTLDELTAEAVVAFGGDKEKWAFRCPECGDVAVAQDFRDAGADPNDVGQECIGRHLAERGCDWAAYGLFAGPWFVTMPNGNQMACFPLAVA